MDYAETTSTEKKTVPAFVPIEPAQKKTAAGKSRAGAPIAVIAAIAAVVIIVAIIFGVRALNENKLKSAIGEDLYDEYEQKITAYYADILKDNYMITADYSKCEIRKNASGGYDANFPIDIKDISIEGRRSYRPTIKAEITENFFRTKANIQSYVEYDELEAAAPAQTEEVAPQEPTNEVTMPEPANITYTKVDFETFLNDVSANMLRAQQSYLNQNIEISGVFDTAHQDTANNRYYFALCPDAYSWDYIDCYLKSQEQLQTVLDLNRGDPVTVRGTLTALGNGETTEMEVGEIIVSSSDAAPADEKVVIMPNPVTCYHCDAYSLLMEIGAGNVSYGEWVFLENFWPNDVDEKNHSAMMLCSNNSFVVPDYPVNIEFASAAEFTSATYRSEPCNICGLLEGDDGGGIYLRHAVFCGESAQVTAGEYLLPNSDSEYLTERDLSRLTWEECCLARNEIYARHGRIFANQNIADYFNSKSWYYGYIPGSEFDAHLNQYFSDIESQNLRMISEYEQRIWGGSYY